jgi:hypothetical protein
MSRLSCVVLMNVGVAIVSPAAYGDLSSLMPAPTAVRAAADHAPADEAPTVARRDAQAAVLAIEPRKARPHLSWGPMDYRLGRQGLTASVAYGRNGSDKLQLGYGRDGLTAELSSFGGNVRLAVGDKDGSSAYRVEYTLSF